VNRKPKQASRVFVPKLLSARTVELAADVSEDLSLGEYCPFPGDWCFCASGQALCCSPISRDFGTHVSNIDLLSLSFAAPSAIRCPYCDEALKSPSRASQNPALPHWIGRIKTRMP
jgi:hypothetical protein